MLKTIRKHQKKLLAIFTAGLMIVFIVDIGVRRMAPGHIDPSQKVVGQFDGTEVRAGEVAMAQFILRQLVSQIVLPTNAPPGQTQFQPIYAALGVPDEVIGPWLENPTTFLLLEREARQMPVYVDQARLDTIMSGVAVHLPDGRTVSVTNAPELANAVRASVASLLLVIEGFGRMSDAVKVSQPMVQLITAEQSQELTVSVVPLSVKNFLPNAPEPGGQELREFFDKYKDIPPDTLPTGENPLGFGYRYPKRVKLQYLGVSRDQLEKAVKSKRDDYAWELLINRYYLEHQKDFPTTAAATNPATQPAVKPLEEVREQILQKLMAPEIQKLGDEIRRKIETTLAADYHAWAKVNPPTTSVSTAPPPRHSVPSSVGVDYDTFEYLERLAKSIQDQFGVLPAVASLAEWKSEEQLHETEGIGFMARDVFDEAAPLASAAAPANSKLLNLLQPSKPYISPAGAMYFYRLTDAAPSQPPADMSEVAGQLLDDWKTHWAWNQATATAQRLIDKAKDSKLRELASEHQVLTVGPFNRSAAAPLQGLELSSVDARVRFITEAFKLASQVKPDDEHPLRVIELPAQREVFAVQLESLSSDLTPLEQEQLAITAAPMMRNMWTSQIARYWFSYDGVASRLGYVDRESAERGQKTASLP